MTVLGTFALPYDAARLRRFADAITRELGIIMHDGKLTMLHSRLQRRVNELGLASLDEYEQRLHAPAHADAERTALCDLATTNKTDFFREPQHFTYLTETALPTLAPRGERWTCRVWCAGCSTGQEVYTLAMVLDDYAQHRPGFDYEIVGTDISTKVLRQAVRATYPAELAAQIPAEFHQRYLRRGGPERDGLIRIAPALRAKTKFGRLNFMAERYPLPGPFDIVFFRNVMIYFDRALQEQVVNRQCRLLRAGGYMFISHSESVLGLDVPLVHESTSVLRRRP